METEPFNPSAWTILDSFCIPDLLMNWTLLLAPLLNHEKALPWTEEPFTQSFHTQGDKLEWRTIITTSSACQDRSLYLHSLHYMLTGHQLPLCTLQRIRQKLQHLDKTGSLGFFLLFNLILNAWFYFFTRSRTSESANIICAKNASGWCWRLGWDEKALA